jgi:hypothetical protein
MGLARELYQETSEEEIEERVLWISSFPVFLINIL